ncbi:MAG: phosphatidate cytidylyltransferase [Candidatus Omnitrophica bacterium]|nr:phosphatidate cytidylyltransferase [Candidatus Omnitrophota bacterium]
MLIRRIISSLILISIIGFAVSINWLSALVIGIFALGALYEFFTMIEKKGIEIFKYFGMAVGAVVLVSTSLHFELTKGWELLLISFVLVVLILIHFKRGENSGVIVGISVTMFGIFYVIWFTTFLIKLRYLPGGAGLLASVLLITKAGDIGAYLLGHRFGKRRPFSRISPTKSLEGLLGGILFAVLTSLSCKSLMGGLNFSYLHLFILGIFLGIMGELGDLSESLMKRDCQVKDSGTIFPGLGGFLDCIDSVLFTAPAFYFWVLHFGV